MFPIGPKKKNNLLNFNSYAIFSMVRVQKRIFDGLDVLQFFTTRQWDFRTERFFGLFKELSPKDQELFNMDTDGIPDLEYLKRSILGGRQYCLKEPLSTLPKARRQLKV